MSFLVVAIGMQEEWIPLSITKLGWSIKMKSMQEEDWGRMCAICDNLVKPIRRGDWFQINTFFCGNIAIPPRIWPTIKIPQYQSEGLITFMSVITWSKRGKKFSKSPEDCDREWYTTKTLAILLFIITWQITDC